MRIYDEGGQASLFAPDGSAGRMSPACSAAASPKGRTSGSSWNRSPELQAIPYLSLDLTPGAGNLLGNYEWELRSPWRGGSSTLNTGPAPPSGDAGCSLSRILQDNPPRKYYLTRRACLGILRRATERVKPLPSQLHAALLVQAGLISQDNISPGKEASGLPSLLGNCLTPWDTQQARIFTPDSGAPTVGGADGGGGRNPAGLLFAAGFLAGQGSAAGGIGYQPECSPTLKAAESGSNMVPSVLCLNDQGGSVMDCSENISGTQMELVRTKEQGHQPLVFENHGIDSRYTGPHPVAPTLSARAGTGGNNLPLALQPEPIMCICGNVIDRQPAMEATASGFRRMWPIP